MHCCIVDLGDGQPEAFKIHEKKKKKKETIFILLKMEKESVFYKNWLKKNNSVHKLV